MALSRKSDGVEQHKLSNLHTVVVVTPRGRGNLSKIWVIYVFTLWLNLFMLIWMTCKLYGAGGGGCRAFDLAWGQLPDPASSSPPPASAALRSARSRSAACHASAAAGTPGTGRWRVAKCASADCAAVSPSPTGDTLRWEQTGELWERTQVQIYKTAGIWLQFSF